MANGGEVRVKVRIDTRGVSESLNTAKRKTGSATNSMAAGFSRVGAAAGVAAAAISAAFAAVKLIRISDQVTNLRARISLYTATTEGANTAMRNLMDTSRATGVSFQGLAEIYARLAPAQDALGLTSRNLAELSEAIGASFRISGASAQEATAATIQLSQAFASGQLRGEELRSVMEQGPRIMQALSRALGKTTGDLREMAEAGELTADIVAQALLAELPRLRAEMEQLPNTMTIGFQKLKTGFIEWVASIDQATGASLALGEALAGAGDSLSALARPETLDALTQKLSRVRQELEGITAEFDQFGRRRGGGLAAGFETQGLEEEVANMTVQLERLGRVEQLRQQNLDRMARVELEASAAARAHAAELERLAQAADFDALLDDLELILSIEKEMAEIEFGDFLTDLEEALPLMAELAEIAKTLREVEQLKLKEIVLAEEAEEELQAAQDALEKLTTSAEDAGQMVSDSVGRMFKKMARGIKVTFKDLAQEILAIMARIAFDNLIANPIANFAQSIFSGNSIGSAIGTAIVSTATGQSSSAKTGKGQSQTIINIDARFATEGTADMIASALQASAPSIIQRSVDVAVQTIHLTSRNRTAN